MERKHIITLSGKPGSGKSSTADKVAELLSYTRYSSGDFVRKFVAEKGMTLAEFNEQATSDHDLDNAIDEELRKLREQRDIVIDSRLGYYWIPESFKVYLELDMEIATARIYKDVLENEKRKGGAGQAKNITDAKRIVDERLQNEIKPFRAVYGVNPYDRNNFDLIIDTERHSPQTVALTIFDNYRKWLKSDEWAQVVSEVPMGYSFKNQY